MTPSRLEAIGQRLAAAEQPTLDEAILSDIVAMERFSRQISEMIQARDELKTCAQDDIDYLLRIARAAVKMREMMSARFGEPPTIFGGPSLQEQMQKFDAAIQDGEK